MNKNTQQCAYCGEGFPYPVSLHHSEDECVPPTDDVRKGSGSAVRLDINPLDAWTVDEWAQAMDEERVRQIKDGYDDAHDKEHGIPHLLNWSIDYARRGKNLAAGTLARCALRLLPAEVRTRGTAEGSNEDASHTEYTIAVANSNGSITSLGFGTTAVKADLEEDLAQIQADEAAMGGRPDLIFIAERPFPRWVRS